MTTGERIRTRRKELGLSAEYLAEKLNLSPATIYRYEKGDIEKISGDKLRPIAQLLHTTPAQLMGWESDERHSEPIDNIFSQDNISPVTGFIPIYGVIPAGLPAEATEYIEGYTPTNRAHPEDYMALRVHGDSMIGCGITDGSIVILKKQSYADDGDIVACGVNGDEATLKRFKRVGESILLMPENPDYQPFVLSPLDFDEGRARIYGVAVEVTRVLKQ